MIKPVEAVNNFGILVSLSMGTTEVAFLHSFEGSKQELQKQFGDILKDSEVVILESYVIPVENIDYIQVREVP